mmetsp:Transcript_19326/g.2632  ORF Transcript_19326/g.2632 Transcript_19326/m.2632 type:complete len:97 (-) Transcript_19326:298-588(-)
MEGLTYNWGLPWGDGEHKNTVMIWGIYNALFSEAFATFIFCFIILLMTNKKTTLYTGENTIITIVTIVLGFHFARSITHKTGGGINPGMALILNIW